MYFFFFSLPCSNAERTHASNALPLNFMVQYFFSQLIQFSQFFFRIFNFFGLSTTEETEVVEMRTWCIKIGIVLVLHVKDSFLNVRIGRGFLNFPLASQHLVAMARVHPPQAHSMSPR